MRTRSASTPMPCRASISCQERCVQVGQLRSITSGQELQAMQQGDPAAGCTVLDMSDWQIIPAENLIAAYQVWPWCKRHSMCASHLLRSMCMLSVLCGYAGQ